MKSLVDVFEDLLLDCGRKCAAPTHRSIKTLRMRVENEGDSFLTITLPSFCSDFERSLDLGRIAPGSFRFFKKRDDCGLPRFLSEFVCNVFDSEGVLRTSPSIDCIRAVRQVCLFGKKILRPCSDERVQDTIDGFVACDNEFATPGEQSQLYRYFKKVAYIVCKSMNLTGRDFMSRVIPAHGPGATQERIRGNQKWLFRSWTSRLESVGFTYQKFGAATPWEPWTYSLRDWPELVEPGNELPVRVALVPKTLKSPRLIGVEPVCMQFAQQGFSRLLVNELENSFLTAGHVNFTDQTINQELALRSSRDGLLATIDMSDASDRVSLSIVEDMLESIPEFRECVLACRSTRAELPSGEVIPLKKFASMGSALCFPIEAMVFFVSIVASRILRAGLFPTTHTVHSFGRSVFVYGDDIIVPSDEAAAICVDLEALKFRVNRRKSFWTGRFRESCGSDCYDNEKVTPVYLRRDPPTDRRDVSGLLSCLSTSNQLETAGYKLTAAHLRECVEAYLGRLPSVPHDSPAIGVHGDSETIPRRRWNEGLQRLESRVWIQVPISVSDPLEGFGALAKCYRIIGLKTIDTGHLQTSPGLHGPTLKRGWVPI